MHPKHGFSITPADFAAAAPRFAQAADELAAVAERVFADVVDYGYCHASAESLSVESVRRLRELETAASGVAVSYQRTEDAVAGGFR